MRWRALLVVLSWLTMGSAYGSFYTESGQNWSYRAPVALPKDAGVNSTIVINADFADLMTTLGETDTFDDASVRVVKADGTLLAEQEYNDRVYEGLLDAGSNQRGEIRFILEDAPGGQQVYVYWDEIEDGASPANPAQPINGTFEQSTSSTPTRWVTSSVNANGDQNNEVSRTSFGNNVSLAADCSTNGAVLDNSPSNNGATATGQAWHLLGYRDDCEDGSGNELVRLTRTIAVPSGAAAGRLNVALQVQAWDGIANSSNYDWFAMYVDGALIDHRNIGLGANNLVVERNRFGRSSYGSGVIDYGWQNASIDLSTFAGRSVAFRVEARFSSVDNGYRSWVKIDDVEWSVQAATLDEPEADAVAAATYQIKHDGTGIYCLAEAFAVSALDATNNVIGDSIGEVTLDTQTGSGTFAIVSGAGNLVDLGSGQARYQFALADGGSATFQLSYPEGDTPFDLDVFQTSVRGCSTR